ncbi:hypothetical protein [Nocardia bovistercoris]|uniref:Uncharacterized protein n=1 Tax=Nocardia bovistercoris TaxID=2785916 RepID=A0A931N5J5_9NOCA|nr:hypothetical protein [Nocardia bovistercoris]MBH0778733.1 hypothetical protein [Nocardia bovistercoris]
MDTRRLFTVYGLRVLRALRDGRAHTIAELVRDNSFRAVSVRRQLRMLATQGYVSEQFRITPTAAQRLADIDAEDAQRATRRAIRARWAGATDTDTDTIADTRRFLTDHGVTVVRAMTDEHRAYTAEDLADLSGLECAHVAETLTGLAARGALIPVTAYLLTPMTALRIAEITREDHEHTAEARATVDGGH